MEGGEGSALPSAEVKEPEKLVDEGLKTSEQLEASDPKDRKRSDKLRRNSSSVAEAGGLLNRRVAVLQFSLTLNCKKPWK